MTDDARYQELIDQGHPENVARHVVTRGLTDQQVGLMVAAGLFPRPSRRPFPDEPAELHARVAELEAVVAGEEQRNAQRDAVAEVSAAYRAEWGRLQARVAELEAALTHILELIEYQDRPVAQIKIRARMALAKGRAAVSDELTRCTCEPKPTGEAPDEPDYDCPVHGEGPPPKRDPAKDIPLINGEPAF
jgi:BMFP domain-containing protein YqiC